MSLEWQSGAICRMGSLVRAMWTRAVKDTPVLARLRRGQEIVRKKNQVKRLAYNRYQVQSQSRDTTYEVRFTNRGVSCECPDYQYRKTVCKHIAAAIQQSSDSARRKAEANATSGKPDTAKQKADDKTAPDSVTTIADGVDTKQKADDKTSENDKEIAREEAVAFLTTRFPQMNIREILDMPPKNAMVAMADAFDQLTPQEASVDVRAHIQALLLCLMRDVESEDPEFIIELGPPGDEPPACPKCNSAYVRCGRRYNEKGPERTYRCKGPKHHRFTFNPGFERRRYPNAVITRAVRLYFKIGRIRVVAKELSSEGEKAPHYSTVARWIHDMVLRVVGYLRRVGMKGLGYVCSTDEVIEDVLGKGSCVSTVLDHGTRFCLAVGVSRTKDGQNSADLFRDSKQMTGRNPLITLSDSLDAIGKGHDEVFGADPCSILVRDAHIRNQRRTNNRHERFNSTLREMFHGRRGRLSEIVLEAVWLYYNYLRPHMALGDITPAEKAGMSILGPNKLLTLIQSAAMARFSMPQWIENPEKACGAS